MPVLRRPVGLLTLGCFVAWAAAHSLRAQVLAGPTATPAAQSPTKDVLGRDTPFGTVTGFNGAVHRGDFTLAARYMQLRGRQLVRAEALARDLNTLLNRYYTQSLMRISSDPAGNQKDGLEPDQEKLPLEIGDGTFDLVLERVADPDAGRIWLFSTQSLAEVPRLAGSRQATWIESSLPERLSDHTVLGVSYAQWIGAAGSIVLPVVVLWLVGQLMVVLLKHMRTGTDRAALIDLWWKRLRRPLVLGLALLVHIVVMRSLGFSIQFRYLYARSVIALTVVIVGVLFWRLTSLSFQHARLIALRTGHDATRTLLLLLERVAKVVLALFAILGLLTIAGLDLTTALAGVGIIGVAMAFGAQKTVENLLGGVFLLSDRVIAVGDYCRLSDREGWIEDITLRSVRLRTLEQTLLSVPAGALSQSNIENYRSRNKILIQSRLRLRYGVTVDQLHQILDGIRQLVAAENRIDQKNARVRLVDFSAGGVEIETFAFVETGDFPLFLDVREQLLLRIARVVESAGAAFAAPPQFMYGGRENEQQMAAASSEPPLAD